MARTLGAGSAVGVSYGFTPILPQIISAGFMKIAGLFTADEFALLMAARMVSVLCATATGMDRCENFRRTSKRGVPVAVRHIDCILPRFLFWEAMLITIVLLFFRRRLYSMHG